MTVGRNKKLKQFMPQLDNVNTIRNALAYMKCKPDCHIYVGMSCACGKGQAYKKLELLFLELYKELQRGITS